MFIGYFNERPYQDPGAEWYGEITIDLQLGNEQFDPVRAADLYHRYFAERLVAEEIGFDGIALNEHHSTPYCMGGSVNIEAAILAQMTKRAKLVLIGNVLPIWDDPLWLVEQLAMIDVISKGRLVCGWVRGTGRESVTHNSQPPFNWERFQEAHDLVIRAWTERGPFRWDGTHYQYRYVNPWQLPYQSPHPPIWIPGTISRNTVRWAAERGYPYLMLATELGPTAQSFEFYDEVAREAGFDPGPEHRGYLFKVHVEETEERAYQVGRKYIEGPSNIFIEGSRSKVNPAIQNLPGLSPKVRGSFLPTVEIYSVAAARGLSNTFTLPDEQPLKTDEQARLDRAKVYDDLLDSYSIITGTPDSVIPKIRRVLETLRPGNIILWDGEGDMSHDDAMRSLRLLGTEVVPAIREIGKELGLRGAFDADTPSAPALT